MLIRIMYAWNVNGNISHVTRELHSYHPHLLFSQVKVLKEVHMIFLE
jgi:hypothetical protein